MRKLVLLLLVLYPILGIYKLPIGIDIPLNAAVFMVLFIVIIMQKKKVVFNFPQGFVAYWAYISLIYIVFSGGFKLTMFIPGGLSFCFWVLAFIIGASFFDYNQFHKYYRTIFVVCAAAFLLQEFSYITIGTRPIFLFPIPLTGDATYADILSNQIRLDRSSCFFREPSHFAQFSLPLLAMELIDAPKKGKILTGFSVFIIAVLILLRSGNGFVGMIVLLAIRIWDYLKRGKFIYKLLIVFLFIPMLILGTRFYVQTEQGSEIAQRASSLGVEEDSGSFMRTFRGYMLYEDMPPLNKFLGLSIEGVDKFIPRSRVSYLFISPQTGEYNNYLNGIQTVLISNGLLGLLLFLLVYIKLFKKNAELSKSLIILFLSLMLIGNMYLTHMMLVSTLIPFMAKRKNQVLDGKQIALS